MKRTLGNFSLLLVLSTFCITNSFSQREKFQPPLATILTQDKGKDMLHQCSRATPKKVQEFFIVAQKDIDTLQVYFKKVQLIKSEKTKKKIKSLDNFGFQYIGVMIKNKKYIYINAFYVKSPQDLFTKYKDWKTDPVIICKGGKLFWGVLFDIEEGTFSQLELNETT